MDEFLLLRFQWPGVALVASGDLDSFGIETSHGQLLPRRGVQEAAVAVLGSCPGEGDECLPGRHS